MTSRTERPNAQPDDPLPPAPVDVDDPAAVVAWWVALWGLSRGSQATGQG